MKTIESNSVAVNDRISGALRQVSRMREPGAASSIAAADNPEHQAYIYFPELRTKFQLTDIDLLETRRRSQWLVLNTYARVLRRLARYLGTPQIKADTLDETFNEAANLWWCCEYLDRTGNYDVSGKYNAATFLTTSIYQAWRDSDCTGIHLWKPDGEPTCGAIEAGRIDNPSVMGGWSEWQDGVLTDWSDRHIAYMVRTNPPGQRGLWYPDEYVRVPAGHCYMFGDFESQSSVRGTPALIHCVSNMLSGRQIDEGNLTLLKIAQQFGIVFEADPLATNAPGVAGSAVSGAKRREEIPASVPQGSNGTAQPKVTTNPGTRVVTEVGGAGELVPLPVGYKARVLESERDHPAQEAIKRDIYVQVALGLGVPVEMLFMLDKLTGPGVRFVLRQSQEWRNYWLRTMQTWQSADWSRRIEWAVRTGRLPKCKDPNFTKHYFQNPKAITIDDGRSASAQVQQLEAGITNLTEIWGEKGGAAKDEIRMKARELRWILDACKAEGVPPEYWFTKVRPDMADKPDEEDDPDKEDEDNPDKEKEDDDS
jgi:hypothetical protein